MKFFLDESFSHTIPLPIERHCRAIIITLRKSNRADLLQRLAGDLTQPGERELRNTAWLVTKNRIRSRHVET